MQCVSRMTPDDSEHMRERYERAEAKIESARDRFERARAVDRLYDRSWRNPYAAYRAGEVSEFGLYGREPDAMEAANMYLRAHRLGDTRATWKLILGHPLSSTPGETSGRAWRLFMEAALPERRRCADGLWAYAVDDGFVSEAEDRASDSSEVRAMLAEALFRARDPRCTEWARRSAEDGCGTSRRILAECLLDDAHAAEDPEDGARIAEEAVPMLEEAAEDDWRARLVLAREAFCSRFTEEDDAAALDHLLRAASMPADPEERRAEVLPYLEYYAASLEGMVPETRMLSRSGEAHLPGRSVRTPVPSLDMCAVPEWVLLLRVTRTRQDFVTDIREMRNRSGGYEDGTFAILPPSTEGALPDAPAAFIFKPTGLELELGEEPAVIAAEYEDLDESHLREVFLICVDAVREDVGRLRA